MKKYFTLLFLLINLISKADYWTQKANLPATTRVFATGFSIGNKGYFATGATNSGFSQDLWEYDPPTDTWTQKANFPGTGRWNAGGFTIGTKAYLGTGSITSNWFNDFWEYDQSTNLWTQKANFPGSIRDGARGFAIGAKGYFGTGFNDSDFVYTWFKDFYEYDPVADTWTQKTDYGGPAIRSGVGFSIGNKGYMGTGEPSGPMSKEFWEYDPGTNSWTQKANFGGTARDFATGFVIGSNGYIGTGNGGGYFQDFWQYNSLTNSWIQKANFGGGGRYGAAGFSVGNKGYIGTGTPNGSATYLNDLWEYTPDSTTTIQEINNVSLLAQLFPNPVTGKATMKTGREIKNASLKIFNSKGNEVKTYNKLNGKEFLISRSNLLNEIYFYELIEENIIIAKGQFIVQ